LQFSLITVSHISQCGIWLHSPSTGPDLCDATHVRQAAKIRSRQVVFAHQS